MKEDIHGGSDGYILGGGVRVGVVLQRKKVRDDNLTLVQTGISCKEDLEKLGFTLEPNSLEAPPNVYDGDPSLCETSPGMIRLIQDYTCF
ncbi:hypothetical protein K1719_015148 [Acacia pycnantha]|nr:hypothetical protein K1719_015148 [Acacia pycnantha]